MMYTRSVSIVIPTFNSELTLHDCLSSIFMQDYPPDLFEVIIIDGGSHDRTLKIASEFKVKILFNDLRTGEAGKSVGLLAAQNELVAFIDSDNILPSPDWLKRMIDPFREDIMGVEPYAFTYRRKDPLISRYVSLFGVCDPLQIHVGNRDRWNCLDSNWTEDKSHKEIEKKDYYLIELKKGNKIPCIGANGFIGRKDLLLKADHFPYYFDIDVVYDLVQKNHNKVAMVKIGIIHLHSNSLKSFIRKAHRRIREYFMFRSYRKYPWGTGMIGITNFVMASVTLFPQVNRSVKGYQIKPDIAWFFHPIASLLVTIIYASYYFKKRF